MAHTRYQSSTIHLLFFLLITICNPSTSYLKASSQSLTIHNDYYRLQFSYHQHSSNIPQSLISLLQQSSIHQLTLLMGVTNQNKHKVKSTVVYNGISIMIKNSSQLVNQNFKSIAQSLSISRSQSYMVYISQLQTLFISNPNDKFCAQHLNTIIDLFLPCGTNSGIGSIINEKSFFVDKMFIGIQLHWNIHLQTIDLVFIMDKTSQQVDNYIKLSKQKRLSRRCMHLDELTITTATQVRNEKQQYNLSGIMLTATAITAQFLSNYYSRQKSLFIRVDVGNLMRQLDNYLHYYNPNSSSYIAFTVRLLLPAGFLMQDIAYTCQHCDQRLLINLTISSQQSLYRVGVKINKTVLQQHLLSSTVQPLLVFKFQYLSTFKPFEQYENVAGGGEEFMNVPFTIQIGNDPAVLVVSNSLRNMFDRLLQPDFSIPFKTITFTLVIIGYLWISLWRAFYAQNQHFYIQPKSLLNEQSLKQD